MNWRPAATVFASWGIMLLLACAGSAALDPHSPSDRKEASMPDRHRVLAIAEVTVTDRSWISDYQARVSTLIERHHGRIIARNQSLERIEGEAALPHGVVVLQFPTRDHFEAFYNDPDYEPLRDARLQGSRSQLSVIEAFDQYAADFTPNDE
jgi:uncharacterized protein (DUF1330 family)